jgi:hypothetical protein
MQKLHPFTLAVAAGFLLHTGVANATLIINTDQSASGSLGTIDLPGGATGTTIQGVANGGAFLNFTSIQTPNPETLSSPSSGQARITGADGNFQALDIRFANGNLFDRIVFNLDAATSGNVTITALDQHLNVFTQVIALSSSGQNFINVQSDAAQDISSVRINSTVQLADIAQVRVNNIQGTGVALDAIPEPATFGFIGVGLLALGICRRKVQRL